MTLTQVALTILALALLAFPSAILYWDFTRWAGAPSVTGKVVATVSEGPFLEALTVQYQDQAGKSHRVDIPSTYSAAREIGESVELVYPHNDSLKAVTPLQQA